MQIFKVTNLFFDVSKMVEHLERYVFPLPIKEQSAQFGGWSVLSANGQYTDGWHKGHHIYTQESAEQGERLRQSLDFAHKKYDCPTEICHSYFKELVQIIKMADYSPSRARVIRLPFGKECVWHRDAPQEVLFFRLHVPIITNCSAFFMWEKGKIHLPANGSAYVISVNHLHKVVNEGMIDRYHLVMDVDVQAKGSHQKYLQQIC